MDRAADHSTLIARVNCSLVHVCYNPRPRRTMINLAGAVRQLRKERDRAQTELKRLDSAYDGSGRFENGIDGVSSRKRGDFSAATRARIATAQRGSKQRESLPTGSKAPIPIRAKRRISAFALCVAQGSSETRHGPWYGRQPRR